MRNDPCFSCTLPDCDERHSQCKVRKLANSYHFKTHHGLAHCVTDEEREANNRVHQFWALERRAQASEKRLPAGGQP